MNRFKPGTKVVCIDNKGLPSELREGLVYNSRGHDKDGMLILTGFPFPFDPDRFERHVEKSYGASDGTYVKYPNGPVPQVVKSEQLRMWDIDDTLILHGDKGHPEYKTVDIQDRVENKTITFRIHEPMVRLLKEEHARGSFNIAWSRSGYQWALDVIEALGLTDKVHMVMSKPMVYFDDIPVENWMKDRVYLPPDAHYKR